MTSFDEFSHDCPVAWSKRAVPGVLAGRRQQLLSRDPDHSPPGRACPNPQGWQGDKSIQSPQVHPSGTETSPHPPPRALGNLLRLCEGRGAFCSRENHQERIEPRGLGIPLWSTLRLSLNSSHCPEETHPFPIFSACHCPEETHPFPIFSACRVNKAPYSYFRLPHTTEDQATDRCGDRLRDVCTWPSHSQWAPPEGLPGGHVVW